MNAQPVPESAIERMREMNRKLADANNSSTE